MTSHYDVAIIGYGPVGATAACMLAQRGFKILIVDKSAQMYPLPRAIGLDHEAMRTFQGCGLGEAISRYVAAYAPTEYRGLEGRVIRRFDFQAPPYPQAWAPNYVFTQPCVEGAIREKLSEYKSADILLNTTYLGAQDRQDYVAVDLERDGAPLKVSARYVLGCDGASSAVRKSLGITLESLDFDEPWLVVDMLVQENRLSSLPDHIIQYCDPKRPATYVVGPNNHRRWEIMLLPGEHPEEIIKTDNIWALLRPWLERGDGELWRAATYIFHALLARSWRSGRVLLLGDAAHLTPPFMAQGMCQGIRDVRNLIWKLERVLKGQSGDSLLDSYEIERAPHVRKTTEVAKQLGRVICELDIEKAKARDARLLAEAGDPPKVTFRQDLIPGLSSGILSRSSTQAVGTLFPQPYVITPDGGLVMADEVTGVGFRIVATPKINLEELGAHATELLRKIGGKLIRLQSEDELQGADKVLQLREKDDLLRQWFVRQECDIAIIRPDHYVFGTAATLAGLEALLVELSELSGLLA